MLGVCYYPEHWPQSMWAQDAREMKELGLSYVRIAEFSWSKLEPKDGQYEFDWLDEAIDTLRNAGLKVLLCTPTATPPKWLIDKYPSILPVDIHTGQVRRFGSRRHYDFSSKEYLDASMTITEVMAKRYADYPGVVGWQTDNELACHDTTHSASENAKKAFQAWCKEQYGEIDVLNKKWGTIFWSMEYQDFSQIELPVLTLTEAQPSHQLAYRRFSSQQVINYHNEMIAIIRKYCPKHFVTHNFIPTVDTQCDNFALAENLDFASYDNYPLGRTDLFFASLEKVDFQRYMRTGHPDFSACAFDQTRALSNDHFWIMEQQPGPVNWGGHNPRPLPGMVRFWSWEAVAHGASTMCYFRWRQAPFAQEQMHAGVKRVDNSKSIAWNEISQFRDELASTGFDLLADVKAEVAILMDTQNQWVTEIERQGDSYHHQRVEFGYYSALRQLGIDVDFVSQTDDISGYKLLLAPGLPIVSDELIANCQKHQVHLLCGPRSGSKTEELTFAPNLAPGKLQTLLPIKIISVETLREDCTQVLTYNGSDFNASSWLEEIEVGTDVKILAQFEDGSPAFVQNEKMSYLAAVTDIELLKAILKDMAASLSIACLELPEDIRISKRGKFTVLFNYSNTSKVVNLSDNYEFVLGSSNVPAYGVAVCKET